MTDILERRLVASPDAADSAVGDETVILHLVNGTYYGLDAVGTRIWSLLKSGPLDPAFCQLLADEYGIDRATIEQDARSFLIALKAQDLVVDG